MTKTTFEAINPAALGNVTGGITFGEPNGIPGSGNGGIVPPYLRKEARQLKILSGMLGGRGVRDLY